MGNCLLFAFSVVHAPVDVNSSEHLFLRNTNVIGDPLQKLGNFPAFLKLCIDLFQVISCRRKLTLHPVIVSTLLSKLGHFRKPYFAGFLVHLDGEFLLLWRLLWLFLPVSIFRLLHVWSIRLFGIGAVRNVLRTFFGGFCTLCFCLGIILLILCAGLVAVVERCSKFLKVVGVLFHGFLLSNFGCGRPIYSRLWYAADNDYAWI